MAPVLAATSKETLTITIDATALTLDVFIVPGVGQFPTATPRTLNLAPGNYTFGTLFGPRFVFNVTAAGTFDYAPALAPCVTGVGSQRMRVNCDPSAP